MNYSGVKERIGSIIVDRIEKAFKELLENKHLYQNVQIDFTTIDFGTEISSVQKSELLQKWNNLSNAIWIPNLPDLYLEPGLTYNHICFSVPTIKLYCTTCEDDVPYNLVYFEDFLSKCTAINHRYWSGKSAVQIFVFSYLCQACKPIPEVFVVRRNGNKLIVSGRTPIEHVEVPKAIPKNVTKIFSNAIIAYQSGQILAANFMFRVLIEQFCYSLFSDSKTADEAIDNYMKLLPSDFNSRFPSFRELYGALSADIHLATGSDELFKDVRLKLIRHFEARRLFEL